MIKIDLSTDTAEGELVASAVSLSLTTGRPIWVQQIRTDRPDGGLRYDERVSLEAAASISRADIAGVEEGSDQFWFAPRPVEPGTYRFRVGAGANAVSLFRIVAPALLDRAEPTELTIKGGQRNGSSVSIDGIDRGYIAPLGHLGASARLAYESDDSYPTDTGALRVQIDGGGGIGGSLRLDEEQRPVDPQWVNPLLVTIAGAGGGALATPFLTESTRRHLELIRTFFGITFQIEDGDDGPVTIHLGAPD